MEWDGSFCALPRAGSGTLGKHAGRRLQSIEPTELAMPTGDAVEPSLQSLLLRLDQLSDQFRELCDGVRKALTR